MTDHSPDDELFAALAMLPRTAGDPAREEGVKKRCRKHLAAAAHGRTAVRMVEATVALISAVYLAQLARLALMAVR